MDLCNEKDIRALLGRHGFRFSKSMGQNFLIEGWVPRDIAEASGAGPDTGVLEIGPGIGPLTVQLARRAAKVAAIELDRTLYPILAETLAPYPNAEVVPGDAMKLDLAALVSDKFSGLTAIACANLPYNITTPVLTALIEAGCFASITVMIQREVALRICAAPGSSDYGAFSVFCQYHTQPELLFEVGPECFLPAPKVTSAVIRLVPAPPLLRIWWTTAFSSRWSEPPSPSGARRSSTASPPPSAAACPKTRCGGPSRTPDCPPISGASGWVSLNLPLWPPPSRTVSEPVYRAVLQIRRKGLAKPPVFYNTANRIFCITSQKGTLSWH